MDLQICLDFFQIVSYITDYYSKDDSGTIEYLKAAKLEMIDMNMQKQFRQMANVFLSHRRMGEAAALYRVTKSMLLSNSNVKCVFVQTGWPESRYAYAKKVSNDENDPRFIDDESVFPIKDRIGLYRESTSLMNYYEMRSPDNNVDKMCYAQFCKEYDTYRKKSKNSDLPESDESVSVNEAPHIFMVYCG